MFNIRDTVESKIMSSIYDKLNIVMDFNALFFLIDKSTWSDLKSTIGYFYDARDKILGYKFGNPMFKINYKNKLFSFSVYCEKDNSVSIHIWDYTGTLSVGNYYQEQPNILKSTLDDIKTDLDNFIDNNMIHCSGCNTLMKREDTAGRLFAGSYCEECWSDKYAAMAADPYLYD